MRNTSANDEQFSLHSSRGITVTGMAGKSFWNRTKKWTIYMLAKHRHATYLFLLVTLFAILKIAAVQGNVGIREIQSLQ
jgi:hypothetical protein